MKTTSEDILLIDDDPIFLELLTGHLKKEGFEVTTATSAEEGLKSLETTNFDLVITDFGMPGKNGLELLKDINQKQASLPVIILTSQPDIELAIEATKLGAYDHVLKKNGFSELSDTIFQALQRSRPHSEKISLGEPSDSAPCIVGTSSPMQQLYKDLGRIAPKNVTVLLRGETGTGKEVIAQALYQHSSRAQNPFIAINCAAIPDNLLESELFGHEKGAFTGAYARRIGRFEQAHGGTLFLDEIGDMNEGVQAKLLRVLQEKTIQRVGSSEDIPIDVRIIAATHRNLEELIKRETFREDLYYRLNVATLRLPPLRERTEDIENLIKYFIVHHSAEFEITPPSITQATLDYLATLPWPGNVRQLQNVICRILLKKGSFTIEIEDVQQALNADQLDNPAVQESISDFVAKHLHLIVSENRADSASDIFDPFEKEVLTQAMQLAKGNQGKVVHWLGMSRPTLREKLILHGLYKK